MQVLCIYIYALLFASLIAPTDRLHFGSRYAHHKDAVLEKLSFFLVYLEVSPFSRSVPIVSFLNLLLDGIVCLFLIVPDTFLFLPLLLCCFQSLHESSSLCLALVFAVRYSEELNKVSLSSIISGCVPSIHSGRLFCFLAFDSLAFLARICSFFSSDC